jgi:hypothetical protein
MRASDHAAVASSRICKRLGSFAIILHSCRVVMAAAPAALLPLLAGLYPMRAKPCSSCVMAGPVAPCHSSRPLSFVRRVSMLSSSRCVALLAVPLGSKLLQRDSAWVIEDT